MSNGIDENDQRDIETIFAVLKEAEDDAEGHAKILALVNEIGEERYRLLAKKLLDSVDAEMQEKFRQEETEAEDEDQDGDEEIRSQLGLILKSAENQ